ncbi:hypothetical protein CTZ27_07720 [Streptomyces griseocarneus]|nr:hypothetical protein CTZ27_07720 [Streptomyces griseocarneus]
MQCRSCGTHRFTDYAALRPPGLPEWNTPSPRDRRAADRTAASSIALASQRRAQWVRQGHGWVVQNTQQDQRIGVQADKVKWQGQVDIGMRRSRHHGTADGQHHNGCDRRRGTAGTAGTSQYGNSPSVGGRPGSRSAPWSEGHTVHTPTR